jgi:hypothetical protein
MGKHLHAEEGTEPEPHSQAKKPDSPPPAHHGERMSPDDDANALAIGHKEAEAYRRSGDAVPATHGTGAGGGGPKKPRVDD